MGVSKEEATLLSDRFASEFEDIGKFQVIARSKMKEILDEQAFQYSDVCSAAECAIEAGKLLSARYMIYGSIGRIGALYTINSYLIDVETGIHRLKATTDLACSREEALTLLMSLNAHELLGIKPPDEIVYSSSTAASQPSETQYMRQSATAKKRPVPIPEVPWENRKIFFRPKIGGSTLSGLVGAELQIDHFALAAGWVPYGFVGGAKYYFHRPGHSWYVAIGGGQWKDSGDISEYQILGGAMGYRWQWPSGMNVSIGGGLASQKTTDLDSEDLSESEGIPIFPMIDLAIGYSF